MSQAGVKTIAVAATSTAINASQARPFRGLRIKRLSADIVFRAASEQHVEVESEPSMMAVEEQTRLRVIDVGVNLKRIEMICQVEAAHRKTKRILVAHLEVF